MEASLFSMRSCLSMGLSITLMKARSLQRWKRGRKEVVLREGRKEGRGGDERFPASLCFALFFLTPSLKLVMVPSYFNY